jgi:hypothetical protein
MPDRIVRAHTNKPAEQQVVVELLQQQSLWWNQWASFQDIQPAVGGNKQIQSLIRQLP